MRKKIEQFIFFILICTTSVFVVQSAYADAPSAARFIENISKIVPDWMRMVTALAYVMGFSMMVKGITELKHMGESRTMMSREHELRVPLTYLFIGAALIYLPSAIHVGLGTFFVDAAPYAYETENPDPWSELIQDCFMIVQLVGVISFIRGLLLLSSTTHHGQHGTFGKAMAYMIGGIFCINMYQFVQMVISLLTL